MKTTWNRQSPVVKTLIVFLVSVLVFVPLMILGTSLLAPGLFEFMLVSALGWTAGGIIVGVFIHALSKER